MKAKQLSREGGKIHALIVSTGDEVIAGLREFAVRENIRAARLTGIGAFKSANLAYFDWESKSYRKLPVEEQVEVLILAGDLALREGKPEPHVHVVLGRRDGSTRGGHLVQGIVRPTLEVIVDTAGALERRFDVESGLPLIDPET